MINHNIIQFIKIIITYIILKEYIKHTLTYRNNIKGISDIAFKYSVYFGDDKDF